MANGYFMSVRIKYNKGDKIGNCTYIGNDHHIPTKNGNIRYCDVECVCGKIFTARFNFVRTNITKYCGCRFGKKYSISSLSPEYAAWANMKQRCYDSKDARYLHYGARGIKVCPEWLESFDNFLQDVGERPSSKHSLDRFPNNDGNYEQGNVRWATIVQQGNNKRDNVMVTFLGETKTIRDWADEFNVSYHNARNAIRRIIGYMPLKKIHIEDNGYSCSCIL